MSDIPPNGAPNPTPTSTGGAAMPPATGSSVPPPAAAPVGYESSANQPGFVDALGRNWAARAPQERTAIMLGGAGLVLCIISTLLPWVSIFGMSISGFKTGDGKFIFFLSLAAIGGGVWLVSQGKLARNHFMALSGFGVAVAVWLLVLGIRLGQSMSGSNSPGAMFAELSKAVSVGIGIYFGIVAGLLVAAGFAWAYEPTLKSFKFGPQLKPLYIALGVGAAVGLVAGFIG